MLISVFELWKKVAELQQTSGPEIEKPKALRRGKSEEECTSFQSTGESG